MVFLGIGAGLANLDVHYDGSGLIVRTGWSKSATPAVAPAPWRADLTALERQLRTQFHVSPTNRPLTSPADADLLSRVRALIDESERRQQRELALRVADVMRDVDTQRRSDLVKIDRSLGFIENNAGVEVLRQRELLNYLVRASQNK